MENPAQSTDLLEIRNRLQRAEEQLAEITARNARVEGDKAWEISAARKITVAALTYVITALVFTAIGTPSPWTNAAIPLCGYLISTFTLPWAKASWLRRHSRVCKD